MLRRFIFTLLLVAGFSSVSLAQFYPTQYRPPNQNWQYLNTPHFKIVFDQGNDSTAYMMGRLLEQQYPIVQDLVGGNLSSFPIILNNYNDLSNGFVTSLHFRSEIELPPIKGKAMNPQTGNWLENVGPHELVHALQMSNLGDYNIPQIVNIFSPDLARSFHGAIPSGVLEGLAVHHETKSLTSGGGRGNYPFFTNQFNATFNSNQRWSMGQLVHFSSDTRPLNRHYIGGYEFTAWLQNEFGKETSRKALDFYMDYPFLGYGVALRHVTGLWPAQLYNRFEDDQEEKLKNRSESEKLSKALKIPFKGQNVRRPKWLNDSTLVFYGSFYNSRSGFYKYHIDSGNTDRFITTNTVRDYRYDISDDGSRMLFSYYEPHAIFDNTYKAELVRYLFDTKTKNQISNDGRLYAPAFFGDDIVALHTAPLSSKLVFLNDDYSITDSLSLNKHKIVAVFPDPENNRLAIIANKRGIQGLWIAKRSDLKSALREQPHISFENGSIFDPEWHPTKNKILFSADFSGTSQLYEFNLYKNSIIQITNSAYNAFEGSYNSKGNRIAYVRQQKNERLPVILERSNFLNQSVDAPIWKPNSRKNTLMDRPFVSDSLVTQSKSWETGNYNSGLGWLKPRTILPVFEEIGNWDVYRMGLSFHSNNLLTNQTYKAEVSVAEDRGWYEFMYHNKTFYPGFKARYFSRPSYITLRDQENNPITFLRQERSLALSVPFQYQIQQNIFNTSFYVEPEFRRSQIRFFKLRNKDNRTDFANLNIANIYGQFNYRLQQNIRDLQPNTGLILYGELEHYLRSGSADFNNQSSISFSKPSALRGGVYSYISPLRKWNQSLRLGLQGITQTNPLFDNQSIVSDGFSERVFPTSNNLLSFSTRYTVPLWYVDDGGFLFPLYLSNVYLVGFSNTVADPSSGDWYRQSRSVFGVGLRSRFRLSNMTFDIGVGYGYEPMRGNHQFFMGDF